MDLRSNLLGVDGLEKDEKKKQKKWKVDA